MVREINFRLFYKQEKGIVRENDGTPIIFSHDDYPRNSFGYMYDCYIINYDEYGLEQYTGIKDKNGVKIYEGDIVKCGKIIMEVKYVIQYCEEYSTIIGFNLDEDCEVIGNIHENPELLEDENGE